MNYFFHLILIYFFILQLTAEEDIIKINDIDNQNNIKSTNIEDDVSSQFISLTSPTTDMNIETTTNPVTILFFLETTYSANFSVSSLIDDDVGNLTTDNIIFNDSLAYNDELKYLKNDIPQFLTLSTDEGKKIYYEIQQNKNMKKYNIDRVTALWAQEQGKIINNLYKEYIAKSIKEKNSYKNYVATLIRQLPEEAQEIHKKIEEILDNKNITKKEEDILVSNLLTSVNQSMVKELTKINYT